MLFVRPVQYSTLLVAPPIRLLRNVTSAALRIVGRFPFTPMNVWLWAFASAAVQVVAVVTVS